MTDRDFMEGDVIRVATEYPSPVMAGRLGEVVRVGDSVEVTLHKTDERGEYTFPCPRAFLELVTDAATNKYLQRSAMEDAFVTKLDEHLRDIREMMYERHLKYGPGNIAKFGELGLLVRLGDKFARLENNREDFSDESVDDTVSDIIGYALIWKMWRAGDWPSQNVAT